MRVTVDSRDLVAAPADLLVVTMLQRDASPARLPSRYAALDRALRLAGVHAQQTATKQVADAIYLLSDGSPTDSKGKTEDPERTLLAVRQWNGLGKVAIHTIGIGRQHNRAFLEALAEQNGGRYYPVGTKKK